MAMDDLSHTNTRLSDKAYLTLLKACCKRKALHHANHVYTHMVLRNVDMDAYTGQHMVKTLVTCGDVDHAYQISTKLSRRNAFTWTFIISAYTENQEGQFALEAYQSMIDDGVQPTPHTFVCLFKACAAIGSLEEGKKIHEHARQNGFCSDVHVGSSIVSMYSKCGDIVEAENVFSSLPRRDVVTWNVILSAYVKQNQVYKALKLYRQMQEEGCGSNHVTFVILLQACGALANNKKHHISQEMSIMSGKSIGLEIGKALHADAYKKPMCRSNALLRNTLVVMYSKCGAIEASIHVFSILPERVATSWNTMLSAHFDHGQARECLQLYKQMQKDGVSSDELTFSVAFQACGLLIDEELLALKVMCSEITQALHSDACLKNYERDVFVGTALISVYGKLGYILEAENVFSLLSCRDVVTWTAMISAHVEHEQGERALQLYMQMESNGTTPNHLTCIVGLQACSILAQKQEALDVKGRSMKMISLEIGQGLHVDACLRGFTSDLLVRTAILCMYGKCGSIIEAENVFNAALIHERDAVSWNAMLSMYVAEGKGEKALELYTEMMKQNVIINDGTLSCVIQACSEIGNLESCKKLHFHVISCGFEHLQILGAVLIHSYERSGSMRDAQECFDEMTHADIVSWTSCLSGYSDRGDFKMSIYMIKEMVTANHKLDDFVFALILTCCSHTGLVDEGIKHFVLLNRMHRIMRNLKHIGVMIDLFGRAGDFKRIESILARIQQQVDLAVWVSLLGACHMHNNMEMAKQVFSHVASLYPTDSRAYVLMSNIYTNSGMK